MGHAWLVYKLKRDDRRIYCSSFAVAAALLDMGWTLSDWGEWKEIRAARLVHELSAESPPRGARPIESSRPELRETIGPKDVEDEPGFGKP